MGIDIYAAWRGQRGTQRAADIAGFSVHHGHVGYLFESHDDEPYVTHVLVPEAFDRDEWVEIPARLLRERLPQALELAKERELAEFGMIHEYRYHPVERSLSDFVALCEAKEKQTGQCCLFRASR